MSFDPRNRALALCGIIVLASACALARSASLPAHAAAGAAYGVLAMSGVLGAILAWERRDRTALLIVLAIALAARIALFASPPLFSHDAYRYLWDGRVMLAGHDPLALAPRDPALARLARDPLFASVDYRTIPSLYPPFAYVLFFAGALLRVGAYGEKAVMLAGDLLAITLALAVLARRKLPLGRVAAYAWSPLVLVEFAQNGHVESWAVAAVLAAALALAAERRTLAAAALACATLVKLTPLAFVPVAFARAPRAAIGCGLACAAAFIVAYACGVPVFGSLGHYVAGQRFFPTIFRVVGPFGAATLLTCAIAWATWRRRGGSSFESGVIAVQVAFMLCTPNALPWYAALVPAVVPLVDAQRRAWRVGRITLLFGAAALPLIYGPPVFLPVTPQSVAAFALAALLCVAAYAALLSGRQQRRPLVSEEFV